MPFGHSWIVLLLILVIVLIVVGPGKLSHLGGALGRSIRDFRKESKPGAARRGRGRRQGPLAVQAAQAERASMVAWRA